MARARNIKPGLFVNDELAEVEPLGRLLFIGLWTIADREGRLKDRPKKIKAQTLPFDNCDVDGLLNQLQEHGFIYRYKTGECSYIQVLNFTKHQNPHIKEQESEIPAPDLHHTSTVHEQEVHETSPADSLNPITDTLNPNNAYTDEFENFWNQYPRKTEKKAAFTKWKATKRKGASADDLITSATNYADWCKHEGTEERYIKHAKTFLGPDEHWREYLKQRASLNGTYKNYTNDAKLREEAGY